MAKYEAQRGSTLWTLWADVFLLWQNYGNCQTVTECDEWYKAARELDTKYSQTTEKDLCTAILITLGEVIDKRYFKQHDKQTSM